MPQISSMAIMPWLGTFGTRCHSRGIKASEIVFTVLCAVIPGVPTISTNATSRDPRESEHIRLTCESVGGNPAPNVTWYRNGAPPPLPGGATVVPPPVKFGTTSGSLDVRLGRDDNGANFTCEFDNDAGRASTTTQLSVHCTPDIHYVSHFPFQFCTLFM